MGASWPAGTPRQILPLSVSQRPLPSFTIYDNGRRWKDFGSGEGGDVIDFIATACSIGLDEATRRLFSMAGVPESPVHASAQSHPSGRDATAAQSLTLPPLHRATDAELDTVARSRRLDPGAVALAYSSLRTLVFGEVCGFPCWILTDAAGRIAEARRIDGLPFPSLGSLAIRKAHTLRGSHKNWPVGIAVLKKQPQYRAILLVEGGPDYLAALHFCIIHDVWDVLPIAMLGRSSGTRIDPEALELLRGRRVRIYPHADADGGGHTSARVWATQLHAMGCTVDVFSFSDLTRRDGQPVKDLNDCTVLCPDLHPRLTDLLP